MQLSKAGYKNLFSTLTYENLKTVLSRPVATSYAINRARPDLKFPHCILYGEVLCCSLSY